MHALDVILTIGCDAAAALSTRDDTCRLKSSPGHGDARDPFRGGQPRRSRVGADAGPPCRNGRERCRQIGEASALMMSRLSP
jgi:hypothetical protein